MPGDGPLADAGRGLHGPLHHPARPARRGDARGDRRMPAAHARAYPAARRARPSRWNSSPARAGPATIGTRAIIAASSRSTPISRCGWAARSISAATKAIPATTSTTCCSSSELARGRGWVEYHGLSALFAAELHRRGLGQLRRRARLSRATSGSPSRRRVLYPLAGLPTRGRRDLFARCRRRSTALGGARFTIARDLLEGRITREQAIALTQRYQLVSRSPRRAVDRLHRALSRLCDQLRARRRTWCAPHIERGGRRSGARAGRRWRRLLSEPTLPARPASSPLMRCFFDAAPARPRAGAGAAQWRLRAVRRERRRGPRRSSPRSARPRPPLDHGEAPLRAVHDEAYLAFLWSAHQDWRAAGREGDAARLCLAGGAPPPARPRRGSTPGSASTASTRRARSRRAPGRAPIGRRRPRSPRSTRCWRASAPPSRLCRPPGHHAGADYLGGYCYLNNAAIAAEAAIAAGKAGRDPRRRLSSRQRHPGHLLRPRRRPLRLDPRRSGDGLSLFLGPCRRDRRGRGRGRDAQPAAAARHRPRRLSAGARRGAGADRRLRAGPAGRLLRRRHLRGRPDLAFPARDSRLCRARRAHRRARPARPWS